MGFVRTAVLGMSLWLTLVLGTLCSCAAFADDPVPVPLQLVRTYPLPGTEDWHGLALDSARHRLYAVRNDALLAIDLKNGKVAGQLDGLASPDLLAMDLKGNRGFVADYASQSITVLDLKSLKTVRTLKVGMPAGRILYDPATRHVFLLNSAAHSVSAIDPDSGKLIATVPLPGVPENAAADGQGHVYISLIDANTIAAVDAKSLKVTADWPLDPAIQPLDLAVDGKSHRLFCLCVYGKSSVLDTETGKAVAMLTTRQTASAYGALDVEAHSVYVLDTAPGLLSIYGADRRVTQDEYALKLSVPVQDGGRAVAMDPKTHHVFILTGHLLITNPDLYDGPRPTHYYAPGSMVIQEYMPTVP